MFLQSLTCTFFSSICSDHCLLATSLLASAFVDVVASCIESRRSDLVKAVRRLSLSSQSGATGLNPIIVY